MYLRTLIAECRDFLTHEAELRNDIHGYLFKLLEGTNDEQPYECDVTLEDRKGFGLSSLDMPRIVGMYRNVGDSVIYFKYDGEEWPVDFDWFETEDLITIIEALD